MKPAFSVIFFTTLIGAAQGLFLLLFALDLGGVGRETLQPLLAAGVPLALLLSVAGLAASFFHLGHPERAWRAVMQWRTSWLSREVIVLPVFIAGLAAWGLAWWLQWPLSVWLGGLAVVLCLALFVCTGMIYASIRFLQEWASPLTLLNYFLIGCASGLTLGAALAAWLAPALAAGIAAVAAIATLVALASRAASLLRNDRLLHKSTLQSAIGIKHPRIVQKAQGFMGGSFNTREFFHGKGPALLRRVRLGFLACGFALPIVLLLAGAWSGSALALALAFGLQYLGLLAERWYFFAQARHPQNLYYQSMA